MAYFVCDTITHAHLTQTYIVLNVKGYMKIGQV